MPIYKVSVSVNVKADDDEDARLGACTYISGDMGIECLNTEITYTDEQFKEELKKGFDESDYYDWTESPTSYPCSFTDEEYDNYFKSDQVLMEFLDDENRIGESDNITIIENPSERMKAVKEYAEKHNAQIYTQVDLDSGKTGYSKGVRIVNTFNQGLYAVVKIEGLEFDNS